METRREPLQPHRARLPPGLQLIKTEGEVLNNPFMEQNTRSQNPADKHNKTDFMVSYEKTINGERNEETLCSSRWCECSIFRLQSNPALL